MAYPDELIAHANHLVDLNLEQNPNQADLRRAVSAAYYAVFHLLTFEAASNWKHDRHRNMFVRIFDHKPMKTVSNTTANLPSPADPAKFETFNKLKLVANNFADLQQSRQEADYDHSRTWSLTEAHDEVAKAEDTIAAWRAIREEDIAQDYLYGLLDSRRR
jgi:uncharacterized protein (UPF0332 family)